MLYIYNITIPAATLPTSPKITRIKLTWGYIHQIDFDIPMGCHNLIRIMIREGLHQVYPNNPDSWITGDNVRISFKDYYLLNHAPYNLWIDTVNEDTLYDHEVIIRIGVLRDLPHQAVKSFDDLSDLGFGVPGPPLTPMPPTIPDIPITPIIPDFPVIPPPDIFPPDTKPPYVMPPDDLDDLILKDIIPDDIYDIPKDDEDDKDGEGEEDKDKKTRLELIVECIKGKVANSTFHHKIFSIEGAEYQDTANAIRAEHLYYKRPVSAFEINLSANTVTIRGGANVRIKRGFASIIVGRQTQTHLNIHEVLALNDMIKDCTRDIPRGE